MRLPQHESFYDFKLQSFIFSADILSSRTNSGEDFSFAGSESSSRRPSKVPFIYYVGTFLGFFGPPTPVHKHIDEIKQNLSFS